MLSTARIVRLAQAQDWHNLLKEVVANGRPLPPSAVARLAEPSCLPVAAAALGLCRAAELSRAPVRSRALKGQADLRPLLEQVGAGVSSRDPVARAFALGACAAVGIPVAALPGADLDEPGERGALSAEGSPLDALLIVWALGGVFGGECAPPDAVERPDLGGLFADAARRVASMSSTMPPRSPAGADLRVMLALASVALRRTAARAA
jgi:hypothetical protein